MFGLVDRLVDTAAEAELAIRHVELNQRELTIIGRVDSLTVLHGRRDMVVFSLSAQAARRLLVFLIKWWVVLCWMGVRNKIVSMAVRRATKRLHD